MTKSKKSAMKRTSGSSQIVVRPVKPEAAYLAVVGARQTADEATASLTVACHTKFEAVRQLANTAEAAVLDLLGASKLLA